MTFLQLCDRLLKETGVDGNGVASVSGQTGMQLKAVNWIIRAWTEIQNQHYWHFLWQTGSFNTVIGQQGYSPTLDPALKAWITDSVRLTDGTQTGYLTYKKWSNWAQERLTVNAGKPSTFTIDPTDQLVFNTNPDAVYTIDFDYYRTPQILAANTDVPILPSHFHDVIFYQAMEYLAMEQDASEIYQASAMTLRRLMSDLKSEQLPQISFGSSPIA